MQAITARESLLADNPPLARSIRDRLPYLDPLNHLQVELLKLQAGLDVTHVPYKGTGPAMNDILGGQVDLLCDQTTKVSRHRVKFT